MSGNHRPLLVLTGAFGRIGSCLRPVLREFYRLRLIDIRPADQPLPNRPAADAPGRGEELFVGDLSTPGWLDDAFDGAAAAIHLAGDPRPSASWGDLSRANLDGTRNVLESCARADVHTILLASSIHAMGGYFADQHWPVRAESPPDPCCLYGVSKVGVEAMGRLHAELTGSAVVAMRIGGFAAQPIGRWQALTWLSPADMQRFVQCALARASGYQAHFVVSRTIGHAWEMSAVAEHLGYIPESDATGMPPLADTNPHIEGCRLHGRSNRLSI